LFCNNFILKVAKIQQDASGSAYNPSYLGGWDWEDQGLSPTQANSSWDPILKKPSQKKSGGVAQGVGSELKPQYHNSPKIYEVTL
jgi:hypothetical protein